MWMLRNSAGEPDAMLTFATIAFIVVSLNLLLGSFGTIGPIHFTPMDSGTMGVYLSATLGAYVARRLTKAAYPGDTTE